MARWDTTIERDGGDLLLSYGFDKLMGFFVTVECRGCQAADYDCLDDNYNGLPGLLEVLIESGAFSRNQIEQALENLMVFDPADIEDPDVRQAATLIENLKQAAGD